MEYGNLLISSCSIIRICSCASSITLQLYPQPIDHEQTLQQETRAAIMSFMDSPNMKIMNSHIYYLGLESEYKPACRKTYFKVNSQLLLLEVGSILPRPNFLLRSRFYHDAVRVYFSLKGTVNSLDKLRIHESQEEVPNPKPTLPAFSVTSLAIAVFFSTAICFPCLVKNFEGRCSSFLERCC